MSCISQLRISEFNGKKKFKTKQYLDLLNVCFTIYKGIVVGILFSPIDSSTNNETMWLTTVYDFVETKLGVRPNTYSYFIVFDFILNRFTLHNYGSRAM